MGFVAVLVLLLGIGLVSYWSTTDLIDREVRVAQTHEVRETIERLLYLMEDLEDKQRLDLLTGEHQYLQYVSRGGPQHRRTCCATLVTDDSGQPDPARTTTCLALV